MVAAMHTCLPRLCVVVFKFCASGEKCTQGMGFCQIGLYHAKYLRNAAKIAKMEGHRAKKAILSTMYDNSLII